MKDEPTNLHCLCSYEKLYRKGLHHYKEDVVLVVNPKCPRHGEINQLTPIE